MTFIHEDPEFPELLAIVQRHLADQGVTLPCKFGTVRSKHQYVVLCCELNLRKISTYGHPPRKR